MIVNSWSVSRGRSYELDKNSPGEASITIIDLTGEVDPTNGAYAFNPGTPGAITLRNPVTGGEHLVFRGFTANLNYDLYQSEEYAVATLELVDGLDRLSRMEMYAGVGQVLEWGDAAFLSTAQDGDIWFDVDDSGNAVATRINSILNSAQWPAGLREIFSGNVGLQSTVYAYRTAALAAILDAADAEFPGVANFYCQKDGRATFHGRLARFNHNDGQYHISHWTAGDMGSGASALIFSLTFDKDVNRVINGAVATPKGIADADIENQRVEDAASIAAYGSRSESWDNLLTLKDHFDDADANDATLKIADYYVQNYKDPRVRINTVTFKGLPAGAANAAGTWALMCEVDISDHITITTSHQSGGFASVGYFVEAIRIRKGPHEIDCEVELDLSPAAYYGTNPWAQMALKPAIHGRDHCPGGADPIPCLPGAWVRRRFTDTVGSLTVPDENDVVVTYNDGGDETSAEVQGSDNWEQFWDFPNAFSTSYLVTGMYLNTVKMNWFNGNGVDTWICMDDGGPFAENVAYFKALGELTGDNYCATWPHRQKAGTTAQVRLAQDSTGAQVVDSVYWEIWYLGTYTGPHPDDLNTVDPVE